MEQIDLPDNENRPPSKSALKRQMEELQQLGKEMVALPKEKLKRLDLPDTLRTAIETAQRLQNARSGLRRQLQYIGRLMRDIDAQPVAHQMRNWEAHHTGENARFHELERWRDRLLTDENSLQAFLQAYPAADIQTLRTLIRNAHKESEAQRPPKSTRALFKLLREISEASPDTND
jgi:ribosome-associated protein